ncbi:proline racemase family protein [Dongia sp.]|uniref:proline racemase family protein n=1 Tax=Dongia sp. TaxID=1977262 RepID=UPI003751E427
MQLSPDAATRIETVEMHTGGEPVRIVTSGYPAIAGATLLDKRRFARENLDRFRSLIMFEPRGHYDMYGVLPVEPDHPEADMAVLFIHNEGYSTMCGHATIALGRYAFDRGLIKAEGEIARLNLQCPCGLVRVKVALEGGAPAGVSFVSVPAFAFALDRDVEVPGFGKVTLDIGYGGAFYAFLPAARFGLDVRKSPTRDLVDAADRVTKAVQAQVQLDHPDSPDLAFLYGTILTDGQTGATQDGASANICVFAEREVDRSPTGSGVTARIALAVARDPALASAHFIFESVTGSRFTGRVAEQTSAGRFAAIRAEVAGRAYYTGRSAFTVEPDDPLAGGFLLK